MSTATRLAQFGIKVPKRIERGPTDILKALASTVRYIPSEPTPYLQDDPFLLPARNYLQTQYYFSKNSGKSTARFLLNRHPEIFYRDHSEPKILAFHPDEEFKEDMDLSEDDLIWCIDNNDVNNGKIAYDSLMKKNIKIHDETLLRWFEMICYTNEKNPLTPIEAELASVVPSEKHLVDTSWNEKGLASKIFAEIKDKLDPPRVYSTMIAGLGRFNQHEAAKQVFEDFKNNHPDQGLYPVAYRSLFAILPRLHSSKKSCLEDIDNIVNHMEAHSVAPDLEIFNKLIRCHATFRIEKESIQDILKYINDMQSLGIEPSLGTFAGLLNIMSRDRYGLPHAELMNQLLDYCLAKKDMLEVRDPSDIKFFVQAIAVFVKMNNYSLAKKLHKLYMKGPNLFSNIGTRRYYLDSYFKLMITSDSLKNTIEFYDMNVPMNFQPSTLTYDLLVDTLDLYEASEDLITRLGLDIVTFGMAERLKSDAIFKKIPAYSQALKMDKEVKERRANRRMRLN